ncbi:hypothetical protein OHT57_19135 [Streptomyces sp. NBC_00285]|uniref:hypothetical protein n=1 Tax=Streptomyces sp. NBC_00285 TaxID=2975700 RepID=UPI002E28E251|nr:hypothetical protein [Streptomyces sp. NBC_00285]
MKSGAIRRLAVGLAALTVSGLIGVAVPDQAQAAPASCGGRKVRSFPFSTGTVEVYKRGGYVCAVTLPKRVGPRQHMRVSLRAYGLRPVEDAGRFKYRAGPVTVHAGQRKVWVKGEVGRGKFDSEGWIRI